MTEKKAPHVTGVERVQDISAIASATSGFLRRFRHRIKIELSDHRRTDSFVVDYADRAPDRRDAVTVALYLPAPAGEPVGATTVILRQQMRYPVYLIEGETMFTEAVAGLIEGGESPESCAIREVLEETGIEAREARILGPAFYVSPGLFTERIFTVAVAIDEAILNARVAPPGDGSPMEMGALTLALRLDDALRLCAGLETGRDIGTGRPLRIVDAKTELALRRLKDQLEAE